MENSQELETTRWRRELDIAKSPRTLELLAWPSNVENVSILHECQHLASDQTNNRRPPVQRVFEPKHHPRFPESWSHRELTATRGGRLFHDYELASYPS